MPRWFLLLATAAFAQEPYASLPSNYKIEFENQYVRISRVTYASGDKLPVHSHPALPTVYVYLNDAGPIRFTHVTPKFTVERPAVNTGWVRFNRNAQVETHIVEYLGDTPSEYLRIELKTPPGPPHRDTRLKLDSDFPWEDPQVRIAHHPSPQTKGVIVDLKTRTFSWYDPSLGGAGDSPADPTVVVEVK